MSAAERESHGEGMDEGKAWSLMLVTVLANMPHHMDDDCYLETLQHCRKWVADAIDEMTPGTTH